MPKPTIVLVHGAWADASSWNAVSTELRGQGFTVFAPPNLLRGVASDASYIASFVAQRTEGPVALEQREHPQQDRRVAPLDLLGDRGVGPGGHLDRGVARNQLAALAGVVEDLAGQFELRPLLERILQAQGASAGIPALTLSLRHGSAGSLHHSFSRVSVNSFAENLTTPFSGTASLAVPSRLEGR